MTKDMTTMKIHNIKSHLLRSLLAVVMLVWGVGEAAGQTLTSGKPYALYSSNAGTNLYLDPESQTENTINSWSDKCILYFTSSTSNNGYYSIKNKNGYYASASSSSSWETYRTQSYTANTCDWKFSANGSNYRLTSIRNKNRYLGVDNTTAGSPVYYNKNTARNNDPTVLWTIYSVYAISILGNPSSATATIGGKSYSNGDYYLTTSQTVSTSSVTPSSISGYETTVVVNDNVGTITITYRKSTTLTFANVAPTISSDGWNVILPAVTLKAGDTEITGQTISYSVENCTLVNTNNGKATIKPSDTDGTTAVITATFAGNDTYAASTATYSVTTNMHAEQNGTVVSVVGDVAITPQSATLDLGGTQKYSVPSSISAVTRNCEQYREFVCPNGSVYAYSSVGWKYTLTPPSATDNANATVNLLRIQWTFSDGATTYFTNTSTYSTTSSDITLTRNTTKTDVNKEYSITATVTYGTDQNPFQKVPTAKVIIPLTEVDLTAINVNPNSYTLNIGETADIAYTLSYDQGAKPYESISYTGYDSRIISVDADGNITAKAIGTTTVTIQSKKKDGTNGVSASVSVTVNPPSESSGYVITYQNQHFLGGTSTADITTFNPSTCLWTGSSGSTWQDGSNYYLRYNSGLELNATQSTNYTITNTTKLYCSVRNGWTNTTYYVRWSGSAWQASTTNDNNGNVLYPVTKYTYPEAKTDPEFTGDDSFASTGYKNYSIITDASYKPEYYDYVFYYNNHHYCLTETSNATTKAPDDEEITYSWSVSDTSGKVTVDAASGRVTYNSYFEDADGQDVTLTLTATSESGVVMTASKVIHFDPTRDDPTSITAENTTVYVGKSATLTINMQPDPCYRKFECTSNNTSVVTVDNKGNVTGVAVGTATITIQAVLYNGSKPTSLKTTATVTVRDKVATPEIEFSPEGETATTTIICSTTEAGAEIYYTIDGTEPTTSSTKYTGTFTVNNQDEVRAIAVMPSTVANSDLWDESDIASKTYSAQKVPTPEIIISGYDVRFKCDTIGVTFYYTTNGQDPTTSSTSTSTGTFTLPSNTTDGTTIKVIAAKTGFSNSDVASKVYHKANIVYLDFTNGNDNNDGTAANKAKKSWAGAYAKLGFGPNAEYLRGQWTAHGADADTRNLSSNGVFNNATYTATVDNNIIYLVGDVSAANFQELMQKSGTPSSEYNLMNSVVTSGYFKPVTISGKYANSSSNTAKYARINVTGGQNYILNEDMRFEYVEFRGNNSASVNFLLGYYDLEMGEGVITSNFYDTKSFSTYHHGYKQGVTSTAHILFYGGYSCDTRFGTSTNGALNFDYFLPHPDGYKITIRSGYFSTISPGGTQWDNSTSLNGTMGSPNTPVKCTITVDIDRAWNDKWKSGVLGSGTPNCDVAVVIAGTHEGTMYGDVDIIVKSGRIDRVVNGTFGANNFVNNHPADSYFGRANILIDPREPSSAEKTTYQTKNSLVEIRELYGGGLGRFKSSSGTTNQSSTYFYGQSSVVINGGTFETALYASGAGGVNGVGDDNHYTPDQLIPYWNGGNLAYGTYSAHKDAINNFYVVCRNSSTEDDTTHVYIAKTSAKIEIHGGVFGTSENPASIYGGGYGYVDSELINASASGPKPNVRAGAIFGKAGRLASSITIDGDAEIYGNVYGAGRGADNYKNAGITFTVNNVRYDYTDLGQVYGNTSLTIGGNAKIYGSVFGAGEGISGYDNMARHFGNTTVTIGEDAEITGGVYGGGMNGSIGCTSDHTNEDGNVSVTITGNAKVGTSEEAANVHGGGLGSSTRVLGNVEVNIGTNTDGTLAGNAVIYGDVYGGSAKGKTNGNTSATANAKTTVTLNKGTINGSLYGGGLGDAGNAADVYGPVTVDVNGGTIKKRNNDDPGAVFGCNNVNGTPMDAVTVNIHGTDQPESGYALNAVYGGGNQADYVPTSNANDYPKVYVNGCDNSIKDLYGGGNAASVPNTYMEVQGGVIDRLFAGGNGESGTAAHVGYKSGANNATGAEYGTGNTYAKIMGGEIHKIFGGSNSKGNIRGTISLNINKEEWCDVFRLGEVYGGGNQAASKAGTINIGCTGIYTPAADGLPANGYIDAVYGGANAADVDGNIALNISGGHIGTVYGGNNSSGKISGSVTVTLDKGTSTCNEFNIGTVFGGGNEADLAQAANVVKVDVKGTAATVGNIYGGGNKASVYSTQVNVYGGTVADVFGGGKGTAGSDKQMVLNGGTHANIYGGTINNIFGGNDAGGTIVGAPNVTIDKQQGDDSGQLKIKGDVYGGGNMANSAAGKIEILCANEIQDVYGGARNANVTGNIDLKVGSGVIRNVFGGNNVGGNISGGIKVTIDKAEGDCGTNLSISNVYGAGNQAAYTPTEANSKIQVDVKSGTITNDVFGGGLGSSAKVTADSKVTVTGGSVTNIYGGGSEAPTVGNPEVVLDAADVNVSNIYGGGLGATADVKGNPKVTLTAGTAANVFGGGSQANTDGYTTIYINGGSVTEAVYGGGALANTGNTTVNLNGGTVNDVYGGGLGQLASAAVGTEGEDGYKPAQVAVAATVGSTTVNVGKAAEGETPATGAVIAGSVFGCNNLNGTPLGNATVNVFKTVAQPGAADGAYHVKAVYGGGNLAAYLPTDQRLTSTATTKVEVFTCDNSIEYVYGGGNAAPTPATNVTIHGGKMYYVFGGGNGKTEEGAATQNPGADVGYKDFTWDNDHAYGAGTTTVNVWGGEIESVFGGSNTKGNIRTSSNVNLEDRGACEYKYNIGGVYGAGNEAEMYGNGNLTIGCIPGLDEIYGGAKAADITGNVVLTITNGTFGKVFGGNNLGGKLNGSITVNIEETGCRPVVIDELYGGGNQAPYSIYGYNEDGSPKTSPTDGETPYADPVVNIRSCTYVGSVFGGGYGETAVMVGNPTVNILEVMGKYPKIHYDLTAQELVDITEDELGSIGTVFGGGNAAKVIGNTTVNIGTESTTTFVSNDGTDGWQATKPVEGANITGNIYGGGNAADVTGSTKVVVGQE